MSCVAEQWKVIPGYYDYYVSSLGQVFSLKKMDVLKPVTNGTGYLRINLSRNGVTKPFDIHRLVAVVFLKNVERKRNVDHINGVKVDNRRDNLRWATNSENGKNAKIYSNNTSGVKGVSFLKLCNKYRSYIIIDKIYIHIGLFRTLEEAKQARKKKAQEVFGEFLNACERI